MIRPKIDLDRNYLLISDKPGFRRIAFLEHGHLKLFRLFPMNDGHVNIGDILIAKVTIHVPHLSGYFLDIGSHQTSFLPESQLKYFSGDRLQVGQRILVQLDRLAHNADTKQARVSLRIRLPGPNLIYCPTESGIQFSSKLQLTDLQKNNLVTLLNKFCNTAKVQGGFICRQNMAHDIRDSVLAQALFMTQLWSQHQQALQQNSPCGPILSLSRQILDIISLIRHLEHIWIEQHSDQDWLSLCQKITPLLPFADHQATHKLKKWIDPIPLFKAFGLHPLPAEISETRYDLDSGGWISFETTAAITLIDVNSGHTQAKSPEATAMVTNLEALQKIQDILHIRGFQGQVGIDLIPLRHAKNRQRCLAALAELCKTLDPIPRYHPVPGTFLIILSGRGNRQFQMVENFLDVCPTCLRHHHHLTSQHLKSDIGLFYTLEDTQGNLLHQPDIDTKRGKIYHMTLSCEQFHYAQTPIGMAWIKQWEKATGLFLSLNPQSD